MKIPPERCAVLSVTSCTGRQVNLIWPIDWMTDADREDVVPGAMPSVGVRFSDPASLRHLEYPENPDDNRSVAFRPNASSPTA